MSVRGVMFVLSSPSGAGKSSLARALIARDANVVPAVSATTRGRRASEVPGVHYHFMDPAAFAATRARGGFLEWAEVHGNLYGTPKAAIERDLAGGRDVIFDIDWQGTRALARAMRRDVVSVFLLPPSAEELHGRLTRRAEDSEEVIATRLANAREEIAKWAEYDHVLVNADFDATLASLERILAGARARRPVPRMRPDGVEGLVRELDDGLAEFAVDGAGPSLRA